MNDAPLPPPDVTIRPFVDGDVEGILAIQERIDPDHKGNPEEWRYHDARWPRERLFLHRLVAEAAHGGDGADGVVGWGQVQHMPITYHPDKYRLHIDVDPPHQRRGIGSALFGRLLDVLRERRAVLVRAEAKESRRHSLDFLVHRGFREVQRYWESRLDVNAFDFAPFAGAEARAAGEGIAITTLAAELARDPDCLRAVYEMDQTCLRDVPFPDPTTPLPYEEYVAHVVESPGALHDGFFLAKDGDRYVGVSNLNRNEQQPGVLHQRFTGVLREHRGKGIAMALKLQTVRYARARGYREIRTFNSTLNRPMLRINEAMGFVKQPVWIELERPV